jgi:hypothetical protein
MFPIGEQTEEVPRLAQGPAGRGPTTECLGGQVDPNGAGDTSPDAVRFLGVPGGLDGLPVLAK